MESKHERPARDPGVPRVHLRGDLRMQHDADVQRGRLRTLQDHLGVLGGRGQTHRQPGALRFAHRLQELRRGHLLRRPHRAGVHAQVPAGGRGKFEFEFCACALRGVFGVLR